MKSKVLFTLMIVGIAFFVFVVAQLDQWDFHKRYHQHKEIDTNTITPIEFSNIKTHLPVIRIETKGQRIPGAPIMIDRNNYYYELSENGEAEIETTITLYEAHAEPIKFTGMIHYRGHSSRFFNKKSYDVAIVDQNKNKLDISLLGMEADNNWVLHGPYLDRSLIRNYVAMNLAGEMMPYAPDVRFVELFVDDRYEGLYVLMEKVSKGEGRVPIATPERNSHQTGYIVNVDRIKKMDVILNDFLMDTYKVYPSGVELIYPNEAQYSEARYQFVNQDFSYIAHCIYQIPFAHGEKEYRKLINVQAFYDYFIINELFRNVDAGLYSTYFYRELGGKLTPVVWDFNNALDNYQSIPFDETDFSLTHSMFYEQLLKDEDFVDGLIRRYRYLRQTTLSTERIHRYIVETVEFLGDAIERNNYRWSEMYDLNRYDRFNYLSPAERNVMSHSEAIEQMKDYIEERGEWLDENIEVLYQYSHPSRHGHESIK
ncbi:CotH kinase family protein [Ureibacillus sp. FSL K6-0786]|uniref:CotH kinase family protein n=1 Tax=Ureibacillus sp. FSL K6-0786 TaxID=2954607 RepID=UPI0030DB9EBA